MGQEYEAQGLEFLFRIDDNARLKGQGAPFSHGTVYVFARVDEDRLRNFRSFYECS